MLKRLLQNSVQAVLVDTCNALNMRGSPLKFLHTKLMMTQCIVAIDPLYNLQVKRNLWYAHVTIVLPFLLNRPKKVGVI